jgi:uncharacterized protein YndB with AHSA1/START domain
MSRKIVLAIMLGALAPAMGLAEVADSAVNGFTIKIVTTINGSPADVYKKLVHNVGDWWNSQHTFSGDAHNLSIDEKPLGCFCEKLANGGAIRHLEVLYFVPGKILRLSGVLGPFQGLAAVGTLTFTFTPDKDATKLEVTYAVAGYYAQGVNSLAAPTDGMLSEQVKRLKNYVETGNPGTAGTEKKPV